MKLFRYGEIGTEKSAVLHADGTLRAVLPFVQDIDATVLSPEGMLREAEDIANVVLNVRELDRLDDFWKCISRTQRVVPSRHY